MISIQTNYASLVGEQNLSLNNAFQTKTIESLTSGYRINSSGDDPAGLAVANQYASDIAQLTQGVINGNSGVSMLQIMDGGLSNIGTMLDRMQTLATESASNTFTGNRGTLDAEFQTLKSEIDREAGSIGLGGTDTTNAANLAVYIGGGDSQTDSQVTVGLAGQTVDSASLGLAGISVSGATNSLTVGAIDLNSSALLLQGGSQTFNFTNLPGGASAAVTVSGGSTGVTTSQALASLDSQLSPFGITASLDSNGFLEFQSNNTFTAAAAAGTGGSALTAVAVAAPSTPDVNTTGTANALAAVTAIDKAIQTLGNVQGAVGAGENDLNYAIGLATSQITNFSSAESQIRDADIATEAANLTKAQVLQQASVAAMAQANAAPQTVLKLLQS
jgi:flagellin